MLKADPYDKSLRSSSWKRIELMCLARRSDGLPPCPLLVYLLHGHAEGCSYCSVLPRVLGCGGAEPARTCMWLGALRIKKAKKHLVFFLVMTVRWSAYQMIPNSSENFHLPMNFEGMSSTYINIKILVMKLLNYICDNSYEGRSFISSE